MSSNVVRKFYRDVVEELLDQSRGFCEEEGMDESCMVDLKQLWESKLHENGMDLSRDSAAEADHVPVTKNPGRGGRKAQSSTSGASGSKSQQPQLPNQERLQSQQDEALQERSIQQNQTQQSHQQIMQQPIIQHVRQNVQPMQVTAHSLEKTGINLASQQLTVTTKARPGLQQQQQQSFSILQNQNLLHNLSGPVIHVPPGQVPSNPAAVAAAAGLSSGQLHPNQTYVVRTPLLLANPTNINNLRSVIQHQNLAQHQNQIHIGDDHRIHSVIQHRGPTENHSHHLSQQQQQSQPAAAAIPQNHISIHSFQQKLRQPPGASNYGNAQQFSINPNALNVFTVGNQIFQPTHSSVIHMANSSGEPQPINVMNVVKAAAKSGATTSVHKLAQLDGNDDDDDDDDFDDLSDDDHSPASAPPAKKLKTSRGSSERLEEPDLGSEDDDDADPSANGDAVDNVAVCQYEKVSRTRNKWKLHLKSGMCSLNGREYVFHKAVGDAEF